MAAAASFLDSLDWVHCVYCLKQFTRNERFMIFSCEAICCCACAVKLKRTTVDRKLKVECRHCNSLVQWLIISEQMPSNVRERFEEVWTDLNVIDNAEKFQRRHIHSVKYQLNRNIREITEVANRERAETKRFEQATAQLRAANHKEMDLMKGVIKEEGRLEYLLTLSEEQLQQISISDIIRRPRQKKHRESRYFDDGTLKGSTTSSNRTHSSRSKTRSDASRASNAGFGADRLEENFQAQLRLDSQRRRRQSRHSRHSRYTHHSRDSSEYHGFQ